MRAEYIRLRTNRLEFLLQINQGLNLAKRCERNRIKPTPKERRRFYSIALASCRETQTLLMLLRRDTEFKIADQLGACLYRLTHSN